MVTGKKILFKSFGGEIPVHAECVDRNNKFTGYNEPAQRHRAFYERPPRRVRSIYSDTQQLFGVIREKVNMLFENTLSSFERNELCTLIYYPEQKLSQLHESGKISDGWYQTTLQELTDLAKLLSSKYTRSKVRKAMPQAYSYIIDELLHAQPDEDNNQLLYHQKIIDTLIRVGSGDSFICALSDLIKRLAVDLCT